MSRKKINILYVDDEENNLQSFKANFRLHYNITLALNGIEAIKVVESQPIEIIITDQRMPSMTGIEFLEKIIVKYPDPIRILLTGYSDMSAVIDAINKGKIFHYHAKPWIREDLESTIQRAYGVYEEKKQVREMNKKLSVSNDQFEFLLRQKLIS